MAKPPSPQVQEVPTLIGRGWSSYRLVLVPGTLLAILVLVAYAAARATAQSAVNDGNLLVAFIIDFAGLVGATLLALPWFSLYYRTASEGHAPDNPVDGSLPWVAMLVSAIFFWGAVLLGIRYLAAIPSVFVLIWYGLFGFAVVAGGSSGLEALGVSVRLGQGRRFVVAALAVALLLLNLFAGLPLGYDVSPLTIVASILLLAVTTNISLGAGAHLFKRLVESEAQ